MTTILKKYVEDFADGKHVNGEGAEPLLDAMISETDELLLAELFRNWHRKGIEENEIFSIAKIMRERCTKIVSKHERFVDIVGTGGSKSKTFNVSTAAAFVVAGEGVPVAKHGNRAATSNSGSADVLSELGIDPAVDPETAERCLNEVGICFMFAPNFHRLSQTLGRVRRGLGFPTIFNCVGPLCNPADAPHQLIGVWDKGLVPKMASALAKLGTRKSWVVHGENGLDEISISGTTLVAEVENATVKTFEISPRDCFFETEPIDSICTKTASESGQLIRDILAGRRKGTAAESIVLINAMAAFYISGYSENIADGFGYAVDSIKNGHALKKVGQLSAATNK